jgi:hypothetical protein
MTVSRALAAAGGLSERGTKRGMKIVRLVGDVYKEFDAKDNTPVLPDDQIHVKQRRW